MPAAREPHCDQRTIGSFKRTFNAAILLAVARRAPAIPGARGRKMFSVVLLLLAGQAVRPDVVHVIHWLGT